MLLTTSQRGASPTKRACTHGFAFLTLCGAAFFLTGSPAGAQGAKGGAPAPVAIPHNQAEFEKQLNITPAQKAKMDAMKKKYDPKVKALQAQMVALQKQMQALSMQAQKEMQGILTTDQKNKIKAIQAAQMQQMQQGGGMMGGAPTGGAGKPR